MRVLLLNPPFVRDFIRSSRWAAISISGSNWYPIYLAYCTGLLEKYGYKTKLVDGPVDKLSHEDIFRMAKEFSPDVCVLYISDKSLANDIKIGERLKEITESYIVLVGPWCCVHPDDIIKCSNKIDALAIGEFDYTILEIAEGKSKSDIHGLIWRNGNNIVHNPPRAPLTSEEINEFPFVTDVYKRHLNINNYFQAPHLHPFVDLFTGRGCSWGKCAFCLWPHTINKGAPYRVGDIHKTIEEIKFIKQELPKIREIFIQDDTLPAWRAKELSLAIINNRIDITWSCYARADGTYNLETLKLMKESGCRCLHVGYESSNQQILTNIRKGSKPKIMEEFAEMTDRIGLLNHADFIIGLPGETTDTIKKTVKWANSLKVDSYQFTIPKPYPGTPLYDWLKEHDCLKDGWANYPHLSSEDIEKWTKWALKETNMNPKYLFRMLKKRSEWMRLARSARYLLPNVLR